MTARQQAVDGGSQGAEVLFDDLIQRHRGTGGGVAARGERTASQRHRALTGRQCIPRRDARAFVVGTILFFGATQCVVDLAHESVL